MSTGNPSTAKNTDITPAFFQQYSPRASLWKKISLTDLKPTLKLQCLHKSKQLGIKNLVCTYYQHTWTHPSNPPASQTSHKSLLFEGPKTSLLLLSQALQSSSKTMKVLQPANGSYESSGSAVCSSSWSAYWVTCVQYTRRCQCSWRPQKARKFSSNIADNHLHYKDNSRLKAALWPLLIRVTSRPRNPVLCSLYKVSNR